ALGAIIGGFDNHIRDAASAGLFNGSADVADDMSNAISSFRAYKNDFANNSNRTHGAVAAAMKSLVPDQAKNPVTGLVTAPAPEGAQAAAQGALASKIINPKTLAVPAGGERLYGKLLDVMGGPRSEGAEAL